MHTNSDETDPASKPHFSPDENLSNPWQTLSIREVYDNPWIRITHREVLNPANRPGIYGVVHFKNTAIGIIPIDREGYTWLVGQYRYTLDRYTWEIPEGGGPLGSDPLESAQRELLEETGIRAERWTLLLSVHTSNSVTDEYGVVYIAQDLSYGEAEPEETEQLKLWRLPFQQAVDLALDGTITDSLSLVALLKAQEWIRQGRINWEGDFESPSH